MQISRMDSLLALRIVLIACVVLLLSQAPVMAGTRASDGNDMETSTDQRRIALVIGNGAYAADPLGNPVNDARAMRETLVARGFEVLFRANVNRQQMTQALVEVRQHLADGGVGLFYFAGHGFQVADATMLAPTDADRHSPVRLLTQAIDLQEVLDSMSAPRSGKRNIVILDTCLNNPFQTGIARSRAVPAQTLIAYATAPGSFADDGDHHGVYTAALLNALAAPEPDFGKLFRSVASAVHRASGQRQRPWLASSLTEDLPPFPLIPAVLITAQHDEGVPTTRSRAILPKDSAEQYELTFWDSIKDSSHASDYEAYLKAYPNGRFAALARARIERLRTAEPKAETPKRAAPPPKAAPEPPRAAPAAKEPKQEPQARPAPPAKEPPAETRPAPAAPSTAAKSSGGGTSEVKDCPACPALITLPPGSFTMGSNTGDPSEKPAHHATVNAPFAIGKYEVTVEQWNACVEAGACPRLGAEANRTGNTPVRDVSWDDVQQYVKWLSKVSGKSYRLPTETEWEYAARAGASTRFWWGEQMRAGNANCKGCGDPWSADGPPAVGSFASNPFGLHDVNGSVWEWVSDCWHNSYKGAPADGRTWDTPNCRERVIRGGSWREDASYMPATTRFKYTASVRNSQNGFRVARDVK